MVISSPSSFLPHAISRVTVCSAIKTMLTFPIRMLYNSAETVCTNYRMRNNIHPNGLYNFENGTPIRKVNEYAITYNHIRNITRCVDFINEFKECDGVSHGDKSAVFAAALNQLTDSFAIAMHFFKETFKKYEVRNEELSDFELTEEMLSQLSHVRAAITTFSNGTQACIINYELLCDLGIMHEDFLMLKESVTLIREEALKEEFPLYAAYLLRLNNAVHDVLTAIDVSVHEILYALPVLPKNEIKQMASVLKDWEEKNNYTLLNPEKLVLECDLMQDFKNRTLKLQTTIDLGVEKQIVLDMVGFYDYTMSEGNNKLKDLEKIDFPRYQQLKHELLGPLERFKEKFFHVYNKKTPYIFSFNKDDFKSIALNLSLLIDNYPNEFELAKPELKNIGRIMYLKTNIDWDELEREQEREIALLVPPQPNAM